MTAFNFRSLLLAAIVLSNCISWTASRHHYTHNVYQHRTRHRRQGAGLYLPASYVIPGGEGEGAWGEWGEISPCSRSCGGGVASQKRICLQIGPTGQPQCSGGDTKYFSCQTQDCPAGSPDFRAQQCAEFDDKDFRGFTYNWVPYTKAAKPCELNCMPHGERFYYRHKDKVIDGTRCTDDSFDVCVNGICQPVGCDMMLGSNAREDKCRECRGNGTHCHTTSGIFNSQDLVKGYNDILLIPQGSTTIIIEEIEPSNNYLALRAKNGTYYLNGHYHIDFPRNIMIAGALWTYERSQQGYMAPDKLRCLGPTNEPLYLSLLLQDTNVGISYEYSIPNESAPPPLKQYIWVHEEFTPCSASCGGGTQTRNVTCRSRDELELVDDGLCDEGLKPPTNQTCNTEACPPQWVEEPWGNCSKRCGSGGISSRNVTCKQYANGNFTDKPDKECIELLGEKPKPFKECNEDVPCPVWFVGHWKPCDKLCDEGKQTRQVLCYQKTNGRIEVLDDEDCPEEKPESEKPCLLKPCDGVDWVTTDWSGCDNCLSKIRTRIVLCSTKNHQVLNDSFCSYHTRPVDQEACDEKKLPPCEVQWYATQWSKCSVDCGEGVQTRKVFCGFYDGKNVEVVEDEKCAKLPKYNESKPCSVPIDECPAQWFAGPWTVCTVECGGGERNRSIMCLRGGEFSKECDGHTVLDSTQTCNMEPCDKDETLPVDSKSTPIMDEEECDYEEDYEEVGLDSDAMSGTTIDRMLSDSTVYAEMESSGLETGSGETTPTMDDFTSPEGSGEYFSTGITFSTDDTTGTESDETAETTDGSSSSVSDEITESTIASSTSESDEATATTLVPPTSVSELSSAGTDETKITDASKSDDTSDTVSPDDGSSTPSITLSTDEITTTSEATKTEFTESTSEETERSSASTITETEESSDASGSSSESESTTPSITAETTDLSSTESNSTEFTESESTGETSESTSEGSSTESGVTEWTTLYEKTKRTTLSGPTEFTESTADLSSTALSTESSETTDTDSSSESTFETSTSSESESTTESETESESTISTSEESTASSVSESDTSSISGSDSTVTSSISGSESTVESSTSETESTVASSTSESDSSISSISSTSESALTSTTSESDSTLALSTSESDSSVSTSASGSDSTLIPSTSESDSTVVSSTPGSDSTIVASTTGSDSTVESSTTGPSSTDMSSISGSDSTLESSTSSGSIETSEHTSTISTDSTTELVSRTSTISESESTVGTSESSSPISSESTEATTTVSGVTELSSVEPSESTTEGGTTTEGITEGSTEVSGSTTEGLSTTEASTIEGFTISTSRTPWDLSTTLGGRKLGVCKRHRKLRCNKTEFGCCPDKKTAAKGPFDQGCLKPRTCNESTHGCCPDGLSPALGKDNEGCPIEPCADTLFGCCLSDNKTAAQGNDQDGCPPPPPACLSTEFGCCADNETEATGPEKAGCPESETTSTEAETETTAETTESSVVTETTEFTEISEDYETRETSEGTFSEGSSTVTDATSLDLCASYLFGCCSDNETEASGPDGYGCLCNATEFGCCSDGKTPAKGFDMEGCPGHCSTSKYGCCDDNQTPAHGPDFEGCCLLDAFGCCPDNRKPAEGPHLEGCGCQHTTYGCCPDNVTIAQGPENQGCGCLYTENGCCPDRHTEAAGPNYEGCRCNTYQFGCCEDGIRVAKGPDRQGCQCDTSRFGCCGDGETPAVGPNGAGCDCSSSKYGCCIDGVTEATGPKFQGCTDAPENKQALCSLPTDAGSCNNYTAVWYYDMTYGGCSRFWYGGCGGNGHRFATKADCEDVCVQPAPRDACKLPNVRGPCEANINRWYYDSTREQCLPFRWGGCLGNANNFDSRELCQAQCEPSRTTVDKCSLPIEQGPCEGTYSRWGFNTETHACEQFIWGGCDGNANRFKTITACQIQCDPPGSLQPQCTEQQEAGSCGGKEALWSFSQSENRCVPFYYSGCGGNGNRFESRKNCQDTCPSAYVADKCTLPAETGTCSEYRQHWFFDTSIKRCRQFYYGGCGGNANNFMTEAECQNSCSETKTITTTTAAVAYTTTTTTTTTPSPALEQTRPQPSPPQPDSRLSETEPERPDFCLLPIEAGPCTNRETKYAYDAELDRCRTFEYGGCGGNRNNFPDETYCISYCHPVQDICQLPMRSGPCDESLMRWFYDAATDSCSQFTYGGCDGNDNRFESLEACESRCKTGPVYTTLRTTTPAITTTVSPPRGAEVVPSECEVPEALEDCYYAGEVWYFDPARRECTAHYNEESGSTCRHTGVFKSEEACERSCGAFQGVDVCKQSLDAGPCKTYVSKIYFDSLTGQCRQFSYSGCLGGANRFSSFEECAQICQPDTVPADPCSLLPEPGNCFSDIPQWYYDSQRNLCNQFIYTGCSGNDNRFESEEDCEARCKRPVPAATTTHAPTRQPPQRPAGECTTPSSLMPCGENVTVFYYDSEARQCLASGFGGCGHPNSYNTEEECERMCGRFRGLNVCAEPLDPGTCNASIPKVYWDPMTSSCQLFAYGGCDGGANRFSTVKECESLCGDTGPARECLMPVDLGESCEATPVTRWRYRAAHRDCVVFAYQGCGGNDNNFHSYDQCVDFCGLSRGDESNEVVPPDCNSLQQECEALSCPYGINRFMEHGCQRCICAEDPCESAGCLPSEQCVAAAERDPVSFEPRYTARCVAAVEPDCEREKEECARLRDECAFGIQYSRSEDGCERCACEPADCATLQEQCTRLNCPFGKESTVNADGCLTCQCKDDPCLSQSCATGERCVTTPYRNDIDLEPKYIAECRPTVKPGVCPPDEPLNEVTCETKCHDDADCRGVGKCCRRDCSQLCVAPEDPTTPRTPLTTTYAPDVPAAPVALPQPEPQVSASEGGKASLRCLFHSNPPPKITWRRGELTIDGSVGRYRLTSDGALEIVSLYRNDTGVYICVADNGLGVARQEIHLVVNDPVRTSVGIAGNENAVKTGELGKPLEVRCLAYGYPQPAVFWYHGLDGSMVPFNDAVFEARGNVLLIRSLSIDTLGEYTCQAYNGVGKAASWVVSVQAYRPEGIFVESEYLVPRYSLPSMAKTQPPTTKETTTTTTTTTEVPIPLFTVPVNTHMSTTFSTLSIGGELRLSCDVDGFPEPDMYWTKDGVPIQSDGRVTITVSSIVTRLSVSRVTLADSGEYSCHASNRYSSDSATAQIKVQQQLVPAKCTDNPFFANCDLIVRSNFCRHTYYSKFCCKSCVEAGQLDPLEVQQADQPYRKK